jgi:hypothetical protein
MVRKTHSRKTHRSKSYKRRHTRKNGGGCGCSMRPQFGGRGGLGGADLGHAYTTGASQELYQMTGRTPGLSSGGGKGNKNLVKRQTRKAAKLAAQAARFSKEAEKLNNKANILENKAEKMENAAANAAANARATVGLLRINAPAYVPPKNLLNKLTLNKALANKEKELMKLMRNQSEENSNNFNNLMRNIHKKRIENN